ncbi:MAG: L-threonylcarbamoyladenylate synthase, partial [Bdellovibrionales bacterium]|nr:L-threonylcarbamoyladenylate synthase [Oligoflexia bacterium]
MKTEVLTPLAESIQKISALLLAGEVVALPTETVYGLAADAFSEKAVGKIFLAKERPTFDPLIVHISDKYLHAPEGIMHSLIKAGILGDEALAPAALKVLEKLMRKYWPGPLTFVLPRGSKIPDLVTAAHSTVGLRCPAHSLFQQVLSTVPFPLAAPSANRFGRISPTQASDVMAELGGRIPAILDGGACGVGLESTIVKLELHPLSLTLLRPGKINAAELESESGLEVKQSPGLMEQNQNALAPGMLDEHYAPKKQLFLMNQPFTLVPLSMLASVIPEVLWKRTGLLSMKELEPDFPQEKFGEVHVLSASNDTREMAQKLYRALRSLDARPELQAIIADV